MLLVSWSMLYRAVFTAGAPTGDPAQVLFPIQDGFPTPNNEQQQAIFRSAHGTTPNGPIPQFQHNTLKSLQLIATNEMIEVSLYQTCLLNLRNRSPGFGSINFVNDEHRDFVIATFEAFYNQEEVHSLIAQGALQANGQPAVRPSRYRLNVDNYQDCLATANMIGDNVLGTSQDVISKAIAAGDGGLTVQIDSLIAQEGQQSGFLRSEMLVNGKHRQLPSAMPAYTASTRDWLFSLLEQVFIQPGTDDNNIDLAVKLPLAVQSAGPIQSTDQILDFSVTLHPQVGNSYKFSTIDWYSQSLYVTYISGQNTPFSEPVQNLNMNNDNVTFSAFFPAYTNIIYGFAIAALTTGNNFSTVQQVSDNSLAGPGTIELADAGCGSRASVQQCRWLVICAFVAVCLVYMA